ncbi:MAG: PaaI family thioesterase [Pigmentiphaga sp.]|uniref:PaaI family thioesterase n=1 Tax=Pigmentiphaga sp. TaxID=1977564 RepID=UPI0029B2D562|nr:PaaI family thioesterase [Pigmentiphaga sp.]MDX3905587.1 PaaI family thioesterase [Pigmentiphaga sp.]
MTNWRSFAPFYDHLGLQLEELGGGLSRIRLPARKEIGNSRGDVHGGATSGLFDVLLSQAVRSAYDAPIGGLATITLTVNFLSAGAGDLIGIGRAVRAGKTVAYAEGEVTTLAGEPVARAAATYRVIAARPRSGEK